MNLWINRKTIIDLNIFNLLFGVFCSLRRVKVYEFLVLRDENDDRVLVDSAKRATKSPRNRSYDLISVNCEQYRYLSCGHLFIVHMVL